MYVQAEYLVFEPHMKQLKNVTALDICIHAHCTSGIHA